MTEQRSYGGLLLGSGFGLVRLESCSRLTAGQSTT